MLLHDDGEGFFVFDEDRYGNAGGHGHRECVLFSFVLCFLRANLGSLSLFNKTNQDLCDRMRKIESQVVIGESEAN